MPIGVWVGRPGVPETTCVPKVTGSPKRSLRMCRISGLGKAMSLIIPAEPQMDCYGVGGVVFGGGRTLTL